MSRTRTAAAPTAARNEAARSRNAATFAALAAAAALVLTACASNSDTTTATTDTMVGGMTECTEAALSQAATLYAESLSPDNQYTLEGLTCADGWALTAGTLGPKDPPADGPQGAPTSLIFEAEGQFWVHKDKADVCGTYNPDDPMAYPADATVPEALYEGCLT